MWHRPSQRQLILWHRQYRCRLTDIQIQRLQSNQINTMICSLFPAEHYAKHKGKFYFCSSGVFLLARVMAKVSYVFWEVCFIITQEVTGIEGRTLYSQFPEGGHTLYHTEPQRAAPDQSVSGNQSILFPGLGIDPRTLILSYTPSTFVFILRQGFAASLSSPGWTQTFDCPAS